MNTVFNVRSFGAKGDGKTVDKPAIAAAFKAAGTRPVFFPPGKYLLVRRHNKSRKQTS